MNNDNKEQVLIDEGCLEKEIKKKLMCGQKDIGIKKDRKLLVFHCCGIKNTIKAHAMYHDENNEVCSKIISNNNNTSTNMKEQCIEKCNYIFNYMLSNPNFCDLIYTKTKNPTLSPTGFLYTAPTLYKTRIAYKVIEFDDIIQSSSIDLPFWKKLGRFITDNYEYFDGFVAIHGSDTICYTASMLSFMFEHLNKPIILTGSQIVITHIINNYQI